MFLHHFTADSFTRHRYLKTKHTWVFKNIIVDIYEPYYHLSLQISEHFSRIISFEISKKYFQSLQNEYRDIATLRARIIPLINLKWMSFYRFTKVEIFFVKFACLYGYSFTRKYISCLLHRHQITKRVFRSSDSFCALKKFLYSQIKSFLLRATEILVPNKHSKSLVHLRPALTSILLFKMKDFQVSISSKYVHALENL